MPLKRLAVDIDEDLHTRLKVQASKMKLTIKDWLVKVIERELEKEGE